jgi:hypothetical protein
MLGTAIILQGLLLVLIRRHWAAVLSLEPCPSPDWPCHLPCRHSHATCTTALQKSAQTHRSSFQQQHAITILQLLSCSRTRRSSCDECERQHAMFRYSPHLFMRQNLPSPASVFPARAKNMRYLAHFAALGDWRQPPNH